VLSYRSFEPEVRTTCLESIAKRIYHLNSFNNSYKRAIYHLDSFNIDSGRWRERARPGLATAIRQVKYGYDES
jgi:hypothetical protein